MLYSINPGAESDTPLADTCDYLNVPSLVDLILVKGIMTGNALYLGKKDIHTYPASLKAPVILPTASSMISTIPA